LLALLLLTSCTCMPASQGCCCRCYYGCLQLRLPLWLLLLLLPGHGSHQEAEQHAKTESDAKTYGPLHNKSRCKCKNCP
jgi:hypothetical protein